MGLINNRFQYTWYGTCGEGEPCTPYVFAENLTALKNSVEYISAFTTSGSNNSPIGFSPQTEEGNLKSLECGAMYSVTLLSGKSINIPGLTPAGEGTIKTDTRLFPASVSFDCQGNLYNNTPTPVSSECIPSESYTSIEMSSSTQTITIDNKLHSFSSFSPGDTLGLDLSWFVSALSSSVRFYAPGIKLIASGIFTGLEPKSEGGFVYFTRGDTCYEGEFKREGSGWRVDLLLISGTEPTPTPAPQKTPTPEPASCDCEISSALTTLTTTNKQVIYKNHSFSFVKDLEISFDESDLNGGTTGSSVAFFGPTDDYIGSATFSGATPINCNFRFKIGKYCYTGEANDSTRTSGDNYQIKLSVYKTLSDECGEGTEPTPTPVGEKDPTPTPEPQKTPTPKPPTGDCIPDTHTSLSTTGGGTVNTKQYTTESSKVITLLAWQGFASGGSLGADLTLTTNWSENPLPPKTYISLSENPSSIVGTVTKYFNNGSDRNEIYYTSPSNVCYVGNLNDAQSDRLTLTRM